MSKIKCDKYGKTCFGDGWINVPDTPVTPSDAPADWDGKAYLFLYPDVKNAGADPLEHWIDYGEREGRVWKPAGWSSAGYLNKWPDIAANAYYKDHPLHHYWRHGKKEGRTWGGSVNPNPGPTPSPDSTPAPSTGIITSFKEVTALRDSKQSYFSSANIDGVLHLGTYGYYNGVHNSKLYKFESGERTLIQQFSAESIFDMIQFKGDWYMSLEGGYPNTGNRAMVYKREANGQWTEVYQHPKFGLGLHMVVDGNYLYLAVGGLTIGGEVIRSADGANWSTYLSVAMPDIPFAICTDGDIWTVGGMYAGHPFLCKNKTLKWTARFKGMASAVISYKGYIYIGIQIDGGAELWRYRKSDGVCKLVKKFDSSTKDLFQMFIDNDLLYVFPGPRTGTGAQCWQTDGSGWSQISGVSSVPWITMRTSVVGGVRYLPGGHFQGEGFGKVFEAVRG